MTGTYYREPIDVDGFATTRTTHQPNRTNKDTQPMRDHCETCGHVGRSPACPADGVIRYPNQTQLQRDAARELGLDGEDVTR